jgi:hypothetical protein
MVMPNFAEAEGEIRAGAAAMDAEELNRAIWGQPPAQMNEVEPAPAVEFAWDPRLPEPPFAEPL